MPRRRRRGGCALPCAVGRPQRQLVRRREGPPIKGHFLWKKNHNIWHGGVSTLLDLRVCGCWRSLPAASSILSTSPCIPSYRRRQSNLSGMEEDGHAMDMVNRCPTARIPGPYFVRQARRVAEKVYR
ncbi:unnamed protein product [Phaeothamnion confervicola]